MESDISLSVDSMPPVMTQSAILVVFRTKTGRSLVLRTFWTRLKWEPNTAWISPWFDIGLSFAFVAMAPIRTDLPSRVEETLAECPRYARLP